MHMDCRSQNAYMTGCLAVTVEYSPEFVCYPEVYPAIYNVYITEEDNEVDGHVYVCRNTEQVKNVVRELMQRPGTIVFTGVDRTPGFQMSDFFQEAIVNYTPGDAIP